MQRITFFLAFAVLTAFAVIFFSNKDLHSMDTSSNVETTTVRIKTSMGDITLELYPNKAPKTVQNFLNYVKSGHYDDTIFHRVIDGFMIQGGGYTENLVQKPTNDPIVNEANNGLPNKRGTVAMARTNVVDSATAQFFINVVDNSFLDFKGENPRDFGYCVFGKVIDGMDVVDQIKGVQTQSQGPYQDLPAKPVKILKVSLVPQA
jgi:cyclophilin family peptidyl-prolyl cis-trans isomerase